MAVGDWLPFTMGMAAATPLVAAAPLPVHPGSLPERPVVVSSAGAILAHGARRR